MFTDLQANLISAFLECALFGIFFVASTASLILLLKRHSRNNRVSEVVTISTSVFRWKKWAAAAWSLRRSPLILATVLFMGTICAHCVLSVHRLIRGIINNATRDEVAMFVGDLGERMEIFRFIILLIDMLLADLVITYRVWHVWDRQRAIIIFPVLTTISLVATGIGIIRLSFNTTPDGTVFDSTFVAWITAYTIMTFCTNLYGTAVIAYRILSINRLLKRTDVSAHGGRSVLGVFSILVESAALYSMWGIFYVILFGTKSFFQTIGSGCAPVVIGLTFTLITIRVGMNGEQTSEAYSSAVAPDTRVPVILHMRSDEHVMSDLNFLQSTQTEDLGREKDDIEASPRRTI